jgi:hypothetical protein
MLMIFSANKGTSKGSPVVTCFFVLIWKWRSQTLGKRWAEWGECKVKITVGTPVWLWSQSHSLSALEVTQNILPPLSLSHGDSGVAFKGKSARSFLKRKCIKCEERPQRLFNGNFPLPYNWVCGKLNGCFPRRQLTYFRWCGAVGQNCWVSDLWPVMQPFSMWAWDG